jgi:hypothetical protein
VTEGGVQGGFVEATEVLDPAAQGGVPHARQIVNGLVAPQGDSPAPHLLSHLRRRNGAHGRSEAHEKLPPPILRPTRPERVAEEIELLVGMPSRPIVILAVDDPRLLGVHVQPAGPESTFDARQYLLRLRLTVCDEWSRMLARWRPGRARPGRFSPFRASVPLEAQIAIPALLRRLPKLTLTPDALPWLDSLVFRGVRSLPLTFCPE